MSSSLVAALRRAFIGASIAWPFVLLLTALASSRQHGSSVVQAFALGVYAAGSVICHQLAERSFHIGSAQMPVCARCTGIYVGAALAAGVSVARGFQPRGRRSPERLALSARSARTVLALAGIPTIATLAYEWTTGTTPSNPIRALAGLPLGAAVAWIAIKVN